MPELRRVGAAHQVVLGLLPTKPAPDVAKSYARDEDDSYERDQFEAEW